MWAMASGIVGSVPAAPVPAICNPIYPKSCAGAAVKAVEAKETVSAVADFANDPMGYIAGQLQHSSVGLAKGVLPALNEATRPDLTMDWFVGAYKVSFALAVFAWVLMLIWSLVQYGRKRVAGSEVVDSLAVYSPLFIAGAMFGPALGQFLVRFIGVLNDDLIAWGVGSTAKSTSEGLSNLIATGSSDAILGGAVVAIIIYFFMCVGLLMAVVMLLIMLVTLYLSGVVFPLGWVWLTKAGDRSRGMKIVMVWGGVLCAQPLLFLLLGAAMSMASGMSIGGQAGSKPLTVLVGLITAVIALFMAGLSPLGLAKFAPVGPTDATPGGPAARMPGGGARSWRGGGGEYSPTNSQTSQIAQMNSGPGSGGSGLSWGGAAGAGPLAAGGGGAAAGGAGAALGPVGMAAGAAGGGIANAVAAMKRQAQGAGETSSGEQGGGEQGGGNTGTSDGASASPGGKAPAGMGATGTGGTGGGGPDASQGGGQGPGGGSDRAAGTGRRSVGQGAARAGNAMSDLAARAETYTAGQMDHHRAGGGASGAAPGSGSGSGGAAKGGNAMSDLAARTTDHAAAHMDHKNTKEGPKR